MTPRYVCIHGHFYQPPRENPWLETVEMQDSAYPYHDWNARIDAECYSRNGASRILDESHRIANIVNNYSRISFNFGPTLLSWLEQWAPETHASVVRADRQSLERFNGNGSAMAQPYNHMIMPLATRRDKQTQVRWGIRDFERRFERAPQGMWLPETAVDLESLEVLAENGILFTVLSPDQAASVREIGTSSWEDVSGGHVDPTRAYLQRLPSGREIALFFYDAPVSRAVAFEAILNRGEDFAHRLADGFSDDRDWPQLMHIATDGESYGHHHRNGDMALAYALDYLEREGLAEIVNYATYLERHPPTYEVAIHENTSWSCAHGVGRWREDCGCHTGGHSEWNQAWRAPLRAALDRARDDLAPLFEDLGGTLLEDCWQARDDYIELILDRSPENVARFVERHARGELTEAENVQRLQLLEMQRHAMLMFTSCGWFFDEISGIEAVQVLQYAARALQLAEQLTSRGLQDDFAKRLEAAKSNLPEHGDGRRIYEKWVLPGVLDTVRVGAHYAVSSLFEDYPPRADVYSYVAERDAEDARSVGELQFVAGRATITSNVTTESTPIGYAVAHLGHHNVVAGISVEMTQSDWHGMLADVDEALQVADIAELVRAIDLHFGGDATFSIQSLFRDEQRKVVDGLLGPTLEDVEGTYDEIHRRHASLTLFLAELGIPIPAPLRVADERAMNHRLGRELAGPDLDVAAIEELLETARQRHTDLDSTSLEFAFRGVLEAIAARFEEAPEEAARLVDLEAGLHVMRMLPFDVNLWSVRNSYFAVLERHREQPVAVAGDRTDWETLFASVGGQLGVAVD